MADFGRVVTAMVTPFNDSLQVNWDRLGSLIDYLIEEQQTESLVVGGTTGESPTLTDEEKVRLFKESVRLARGRCKIIAGTGSNDTAHTVHLTKQAEKAGVDGVLLVAPYYNKPSQEGVYRHFKAAAEVTSLPVMLYNIPGRSGIHVCVETTLRLAEELPNIVASKESHSNLDHVTTLIAKAPEHFRVYSGDDSLTLPFLSVGSYGVVSVASHLIGKDIQAMIHAFVKGEVQNAAKLHQKLSPIFKGLFECPYPVPSPTPVKYALNRRGIDVGGVRLPLVPVSEAEGRFIDTLFS